MNISKKYRVLGIDPGLNITGYAVLDFAGADVSIVEAGAIKPDKSGTLQNRIAHIYADVREIIRDTKPETLAIEEIYSHYKHPKTSVIMAHARGAIILAAELCKIGVRNLPATKVKKSLTGNGHATKMQIQTAVQGFFKLPELPTPADVADAIAIALCAGRNVSV